VAGPTEHGVSDGGAAAIRGALDVPRRALVAALGLSLLAYAAVATDVVEQGPLWEQDGDVSRWVAGSMPGWAEWLARPFSWVGGAVGVTVLVAAAVLWLLRSGRRIAAATLVAVAAGSQLLISLGKEGYDRPRPTAGSPVDIPGSPSFPSGHAGTIAVFGLFGLLLADLMPTRAWRVGVTAAGFGLGALVGASRVVLDVHFVTDVLAGAALGLAWLAACLLVAGLVAGGRRR
jgi:undecaprenyl-diphosphatase